jgi:hypothetical protein
VRNQDIVSVSDSATLADRRAYRRVGEVGGEVVGEADDVGLVRASTVEQHDERTVVSRVVPGDNGWFEAGHERVDSGSMAIVPAVVRGGLAAVER